MEWFSAMFTIGNMSENTFCLYEFNTLHSTEKRNPIFHVSHCLTYFTYHNDLTETEEIKKRGQEYIEELYKKVLNNMDNHAGVVIHLVPDILECEVKRAWESIMTNKVSGTDGIPAELFQILKDDPVKMLHSMCQQIWKTQQCPQD